MSSDDREDLLARLARGDMAVAETLFAAFAPFLRAVVRCQLSARMHAKLDSADVVQSVWVQVVRHLRHSGWQVDDENQLKALLATIARRRLATHVRRISGPAGDEQDDQRLAETADPRHPRPSEIAQANDLWSRMLELCPPDHHSILTLKREGLTLAQIATRTGLHEGSVRRILRRLSRDLAMASPSIESTPRNPQSN